MNTIAKIALLSLALTTPLAMAQGQSQKPPTYDGLKKTVSVEPFLATESTGGAVTAEGMTAMLTAALHKDGRFIVVERPGLTGVLAEQALGQSGALNAETAARPGQLIGASTVVRAVVTKFQAGATGGGLTLGVLPFGSLLGGGIGVKNQTSVMEIALRLIDTTTGQVISTASAQGSASSRSADATLINPQTGMTAGAGTFEHTPMGQAGEQAIAKAVEQIASGMKSVPWSALVIDTNHAQVFVNAGSERNVQVGMQLNLYRKGAVLTDPATGIVLDVEMEKIGVVQIMEVREKISIAAVVIGEKPTRGNILRPN